MKSYVVDASVILKWLLPQNISPFQQQALSIREGLLEVNFSLIVPTLWRYEVANTLGRIVPGSASDLLTHCSNIGLQEINDSIERDRQALEMMVRHPISFYDASYHVLAIQNDIKFITADEKYYRKVVPEYANIILLKDWTVDRQ